MPAKHAIPSLRRHRSGRAFVQLNGKRIYIGPWGDPATERKYAALIADWLANNRRLPLEPAEMTIADLLLRYLDYAENYYLDGEGRPTSQLGEIKVAMRPLKNLYADSPAKDFGPLRLKACRAVWLEEDLSRKTINSRVQIIRRIFKWGVANELLPVTVWQALEAVEGLRRGRGRVKEHSRVQPVPEADIEAVLESVASPVAAVIRLQLTTAARPSELLELRPVDIDMEGAVWVARIRNHKTSRQGKERLLFFGPRAQAILKPFLLRPADAYLFSPREAVEEYAAAAPTHRRSDQKPNKTRTSRNIGEKYTADSYRRSITRVCISKGISPWTPYQLRHNAATRIRRDYNLEAAQLVLGHADLSVTQVYAEANYQKALQIALEIG
jgi:integrase